MLQVEFQIHYHAQEDESIVCQFRTPHHSAGSIQLQNCDGHRWTARLTLPDGTPHIAYRYALMGRDGIRRRMEEGAERRVDLQGQRLVLCVDSWFDRPLEPAFQHASFAQTVTPYATLPREEGGIEMQLYAPAPPAGYVWAVVGESLMLGEWDAEQALALSALAPNHWAVRLDGTEVGEYKYILRSLADPLQVIWEAGENRCFTPPAYAKIGSIVKADCSPDMGDAHWRCAGVVIPMFSLRSEGSQGIGDFGDLRTLIDWVSSVGMHAVQLLPINDTSETGTRGDSYPYNSLSVFALHPLYLDLRPWENEVCYAHYRPIFEALNAEKVLDYEAVHKAKMAFLRELFIAIGLRTLAQPAYRKFAKENADWLPAYALFYTLKEKHRTANFRTWEELSTYDYYAVAHYLENHPAERAEMEFYCFVQYLLFEQMEEVHAYARSKQVLLKGDLPIGINRNSVEAWMYPHLFHFNGQAGAPPDAFAVLGQNWGFPTYNWEEMARDGYAWWRRRLAVMNRSFDAYRIDHVLGFFRIWEIPTEQVQGLLGRFRPALPLTPTDIAHFGFFEEVEVLSVASLSRHRLEELAQRANCPDLSRYFVEQAGNYYLRNEVDTQRKIIERIEDEALREALLEACTEVLFVKDPLLRDGYHPRIGAQQTARFRALPIEAQAAFNRLHDDFFYVRHNQFWATEALKKLRAIVADSGQTPPMANGMLPCAEDLGMVPASVKGVLEQLHILSLEIQRMPKTYGVRFDDVCRNPYYSVATIATHDMPPLRLWWEQSPAERQAFWSEALHHEGEAPAEATPAVCETIISQHLASPSMLCLLAWQDWMSLSPTLRAADPTTEQINEPSNPHHYWGYRMHLSLETLLASEDLNAHLRHLIARHGR